MSQITLLHVQEVLDMCTYACYVEPYETDREGGLYCLFTGVSLYITEFGKPCTNAVAESFMAQCNWNWKSEGQVEEENAKCGMDAQV